jgi:uncharacterized protein (DUF1330 family)
MPAYLLVTATVSDPARLAVYNQALAASGLYPRHGGRYIFLGRAAENLENWDGKAVVCAEFPDLAAAHAFWNSAEYQNDIKPLREGAGTFHVAIFEGAA